MGFPFGRPDTSLPMLSALTLLGIIQCFALAVFVFGFFLTRQEVPHYSHCHDSSLWPVASPLHHSSPPSPSKSPCWSSPIHPLFDRAVIVVIDALRFDFINPYDEEALATRIRQEGTRDAKYHLNKMPVVRELMATDPTRALLYRFEADPPTTTVQRLKGLTTGALPTFLDFRQNFHSPAIAEDNLVHQLKQAGKRITFMGDDTWELLFPGAFDRSFPYPSFNTRDLDTVDNGVLAHLQPELQRSFRPPSNQTASETAPNLGMAGGGKSQEDHEPWDVLIAHFLGADHVGHTHGPSHPAMASKLTQLDRALRGLVETLEGERRARAGRGEQVLETLIVVMGDHGMTDDGNHGGASQDETEAALFLYSSGKELVAGTEDEGREGGREGGGEAGKKGRGVYVWRDSTGKEEERGGLVATRLNGGSVPRRVAQVDLVPTLALLLGVPVPYPNLGSVMPELFFAAARQGGKVRPGSGASLREEGWEEHWEGLTHAFQANAFQMHRYLRKYGEVASLPEAEMAFLEACHARAVRSHREAVEGEASGREEGLRDACIHYRRFLTEALALGRRIWTQYDVGLMLWGILLLALSLVGGAMVVAPCFLPPAMPLSRSKSVKDSHPGMQSRGSLDLAAPAAHGHDIGDSDLPPNPYCLQQWRLPDNLFLRYILGVLAVTLLVSWSFPVYFFQRGNDHAATVIPCLLVSLLLGGIICLAVREDWKAASKVQEKRGWSWRPSVPVGISLGLVSLHGISLFSNSFIEREESVHLFLGGSTAALLWVLRTTKQAAYAGVDNSQAGSGGPDKTSCKHSSLHPDSHRAGFLYPAWLIPTLLVRVAFEAKGHGQDVVAHFHIWPTLAALLALLVGYHCLSTSWGTPSPSPTSFVSSFPTKRSGYLAVSYLLVLLYWIVQVDAQDLPLWLADLTHLGLPRLLYSASLIAFLTVCRTTYITLGPSGSNAGSQSSSANFCLDLAALSLSPPLLLVLGPMAPLSLLCLGGMLWTLRKYCCPAFALAYPSFPYLVAVSFLGRAFFFATGHHSQFNRLQYSSAFVGFDEFSFVIGGCLLFLNTFGTELLVLLLLGHDVLSCASSSYSASLLPSLGTKLLVSDFRCLLTTLCVLLQRRHLMVWAIFAPKFIFDACLHVVLSMGCLGLLWGLSLKENAWRKRGTAGPKIA